MRYDWPIIVPVAFERIYRFFTGLTALVRTHWLSFWWGMKIGKGVRFVGPTIIRTRRRGDIVIGDGTVFNSNSTLNPVGLSGPTVIDTRPGGRLVVGSHSGFSSVVISTKTSVQVGNHVNVGGNVRIFDHDFHALDPAIRNSTKDKQGVRSGSVVIEDECFIGTNAIILRGTHLQKQTIVSAGSVVAGIQSSVKSLIKGNPAHDVR